MKLHELRPQRGAVKRRKRIGRGPGSGHGKTSCRGHKGLKARSGPNLRPGFEGGQMPLIRRIPKRGFIPRTRFSFQVVNLSALTKLKYEQITPLELEKSGLIKSAETPVKILGTGELTKAVNVEAHAFSKSAIAKIKKAGGKHKEIKK